MLPLPHKSCTLNTIAEANKRVEKRKVIIASYISDLANEKVQILKGWLSSINGRVKTIPRKKVKPYFIVLINWNYKNVVSNAHL